MDGLSTQRNIDGRLRRARDFIYSAYAQPLDLLTISQQAQLSPFHFLRSFRSAFELTPHEYLTHLRIERAKELLASEHLPVTEVCFEVGFESLGSFSTLFAKHVGESPSAFRRRMESTLPLGGDVVDLGDPALFSVLVWLPALNTAIFEKRDPAAPG